MPKPASFSERSSEPEILDNYELSGNDLAQNLHELALVNRYLGGYRCLRYGVKRLLPPGPSEKPLHILEAGCGGGDNLRYLAHWARKKNLRVTFTGLDANPQVVERAREWCRDYPEIRIEQGDLRDYDYRGRPADLICFNLVLHHLDDAALQGLLPRLRDQPGAVLINDLHRSFIAYQAFRLFSRLMGFSYIGRHDGKLSIRKSFRAHEWKQMFIKSGISEYHIRWRWAFRYLVLIASSPIQKQA